MRVSLLVAALCGIALADGGGIPVTTCSTSDYTVDTVTTTIWQAKVARVRRNGVEVTTGSFSPSNDYLHTAYPISQFGQLQLKAKPTSTSQAWTHWHLSGAGFYVDY